MKTVLALAVAGCSPGIAPSPTDPHGVVTTTTVGFATTTLSVEESVDAYTRCLADEGVVIDEIPLDARGRPRMALALANLDITDAAVVDALTACGSILAAGLLDLSPDPELRTMVRSRLEELAECVRDRGVEAFPDPVADFEGVGPPFPVDLIPWSDPGLPGALADCASVGDESL